MTAHTTIPRLSEQAARGSRTATSSNRPPLEVEQPTPSAAPAGQWHSALDRWEDDGGHVSWKRS